jgi:hypothetical protein
MKYYVLLMIICCRYVYCGFVMMMLVRRHDLNSALCEGGMAVAAQSLLSIMIIANVVTSYPYLVVHVCVARSIYIFSLYLL